MGQDEDQGRVCTPFPSRPKWWRQQNLRLYERKGLLEPPGTARGARPAAAMIS